ncbi:MAG: phenylacetate--CoA ligase [Spirochaetes bacterium]|nr:phenylacetate--CoA ligase [Spirochaetota bacterium]
MIWNEKIETMNLEDLKEVQSKRLKSMLDYIYNNSTFYKNKFDKEGINIEDIKSIDDITKLPFTTKEDMRDNYPFGIFSNKSKLAEIHVSSGTTGNPTLVGYTKDDIGLWSDVMARTLGCAGAKPGDVIQIAYGYGLFTGGLGFHYGALEMGLTIIPCSAGMTKRQLKIMEDFKPRILACTPSYAMYMSEDAKDMGMDPRKSSWEIGIFGAEPWSESMRTQIENTWNILATDVYGLSEIIGPGVAQECTNKEGLHVFSDVFYPEIINPTTGQPVKEGEDGELVFTTFTKKAIPVLRYRTRDIVSMTNKQCKCGRTSPRISKIKGRTDDMIVVRGINVFPSQIEHVLVNIEGTTPHYQLVVDRSSKNLDTLEIHVEVEQKIFSDEIKKLTQFENKIQDEIESMLGVSVKVKLLEPRSIERSIGKAVRVIDKRNI